MISIMYGVCGTALVVLLAWIIRNKYMAEQFRQKRNAYVNSLYLGKFVTDEYRKYFTTTNERYETVMGLQLRYVSGVIHLKNHDYTIKIHNDVVKELRKTLR
jgi:hypothetical protein